MPRKKTPRPARCCACDAGTLASEELDAALAARGMKPNAIDADHPALEAIFLAFKAGAIAAALEHVRILSPDAAGEVEALARENLAAAYRAALLVIECPR